jgi:hypothetical protein
MVLKATAESYNAIRWEPLEDVGPYEILREMITELHESGKL